MVAPTEQLLRAGAMEPTGYLHESYAQSLSEFGAPRLLRYSGGWVLEQPVPEFDRRDARGCYPFFACRDWSQLHRDFSEHSGEWVAVYMVLDPFGDYAIDLLHDCFEDVVIPFKEHYVIDLRKPLFSGVSPHHRRYARKALRSLEFSIESQLGPYLREWVELYDKLRARKHIKGLAAFSRDAFAKQFEVPGILGVRAGLDGMTVGMQLWFTQGAVAYYHLGASSKIGYDTHAAFGMFWTAIEYFSHKGLTWISLGGGPGLQVPEGEGLRAFKRGWANDARVAYFCGRILDKEQYAKIVEKTGTTGADYFPVYRSHDVL